MGRAKKKQRGADIFHQWYEDHWGDRWQTLAEAMTGMQHPVAWWNPHTSLTTFEALPADARRWQPQGADADPLQPCWVADVLSPPPLDDQGRPAYYILDGASLLAAAACPVTAGENVLDMCAAPGGKSLYLATAVGPTGLLTANELSRPRGERLKRVLHSYLPAEWCELQLRLTRHDASRWCLYEQSQYDGILLDVPCSSEHHVLQDPKALASWSPARSKQLAIRQYALLASALEVVKVGGWITYSTCSVSPLECDQIIAKLHKKRAARFELTTPSWQHGEATEYGRWLLPDQPEGWGPIYVATLRRIA